MEGKDKILLCGREFTQKELDNVIETVKMFSNLSRSELAFTICDHLEWYTPAGNYKIQSALSLLEKLQKQGKVDLPDKQKMRKTTRGVKKLTFKTETKAEISGTASDFYPIKVELVETKTKRNLWNEYVERYHTLGYKQPFGARQRYFIIGTTI